MKKRPTWQPSKQFALELIAILILFFSAVVTTADLGLSRPVLGWVGVALVVLKALEHRYTQQAINEALHTAPPRTPPAEEHHTPPAPPPTVPEPPQQGDTLPAYRKDDLL